MKGLSLIVIAFLVVCNSPVYGKHNHGKKKDNLLVRADGLRKKIAKGLNIPNFTILVPKETKKDKLKKKILKKTIKVDLEKSLPATFHKHNKKHHHKHMKGIQRSMSICRGFSNCPGPIDLPRVTNGGRLSCCMKCAEKERYKVGPHHLRAEFFDCLGKCQKCQQLKE